MACEGDAATVIDSNKNPEQLARDQIDALLTEAGWARSGQEGNQL